MSESDIAGFCAQSSVYRPGMDVTKAELVGRTNWRRQEKTESVGEWKARVYELHNVVFSFRSRKVHENDVAGSEQVLPLELDEDDDGFLVAENPSFGFNVSNNDRRRHSSFVREERDFVTVGRKSVDIIPSAALPRRSTAVMAAPPPTKEKEFVKSLRPSIWLTEQFPLKTEELIPLLDILANKVKAVRRLRELLTTKFPPGTFPVKVRGNFGIFEKKLNCLKKWGPLQCFALLCFSIGSFDASPHLTLSDSDRSFFCGVYSTAVYDGDVEGCDGLFFDFVRSDLRCGDPVNPRILLFIRDSASSNQGFSLLFFLVCVCV